MDTDNESSSSSDAPVPCTGFVAASSNFSIQYNFTCASIATAIMLSHADDTGEKLKADYPEPAWAQDVQLAVVFVGSVVGMLTMGYLGDLIGIKKALVISNSLTVLGALASALLSWGRPDTVWAVIISSRFVLGVGVGGNYPLSAAKASQNMQAEEAVKKAAFGFVWQGPGSLLPYLLALALLQLPRNDHVTSVQFRVLLGFGALPALVVLLAAMAEDSDEPSAKHGGGNRGSQRRQALADPAHWWTLVGTAGAWLLFDIAWYGTVIFTPTILQQVFGPQQSLEALAWRAAFMAFLSGLVGNACGLLLLRCVGAKALNTGGLLVAGFLFAAFLSVYISQPDQHWVLFGFLCLVMFTLAAGPNIATYVLPVQGFPEEVRSTFHGLSAAAAKVGAMLGAFLFPVLDSSCGIAAVMGVQASVCIAGAAISHIFVRSASGDETTDQVELVSEDAEVESQRLLR